MNDLFLTLVNMSITATWAVLAFTILRPLLKKVPKWVNCLLWGVVGLRLCLPFSFESALSLIPSAETIPTNITVSSNPQIDTGVDIVNNVVNPVISNAVAPYPSYSVNPLMVVVGIASYIWVIGLILMVLYSLVSFVILKRKVSASVLYKDNIYYCDNIETPFILGIIKPKIYVPSGLNEEDLEFVLEHEKSHLKRKDHIIKPISFLILSVYWFNPAIWLWYIFLCRDIESACDEKVIKNYDTDSKKLYSTALLNCSANRRMIMACPVAFGEVGVKDRIKSVLNYKKPAFWVVLVAVILSFVLAICFVSNPVNDKVNKILNEDGFDVISANEKDFSIFFVTGLLTDEMFEQDGVYKVKGRDTYNDFVEFNFKEVYSHEDMFTLTFDITYKDIPDEGTIYVLESKQFEGGLELGEKIDVYDATGDFSHYSSYCHSKGPDTEFLFSVPKKWFKNRRDTKIEVEFDVLEVVYEKSQNKGNSSSIGIIGGADGPTSIIVSDKNDEKEIERLQEKYPHFFNLDDSDGLTVYVTALGEDNYRWYLSSNKTPVDPQKIMSFSEFSQTDEIPLILSVYNIDDEDIEVVPFQHMLSSFWWEKGEQDTEYLRSLVGLPSMYDTALKTFNAIVVDIAPQGIVVEPFENEAEWNKEFNKILIWDIFSCVVNEKVRVVYDGRVSNELSMFPQNIDTAIAVYSITDEKESSKTVNVNIDKNLLLNNTVVGYRFDEETFLKEMKEYDAGVIQTNDGAKYSVAFSESQYNKYLTDKYNQVSVYYNSIKDDDDEYAVIKKVEFDENFRNLKIYINKELWEVMAYDCTKGVASQAYSYQMFLEDGIGVNVEVINNKTNNVYNSYTLPYDY